VAPRNVPVTQCSKPSGWLGRFSLWRMNASHSGVTDWGLSHVSLQNHHTILDIGCGGGRTIGKLAASSPQSKVFGVDYSEASVAASTKLNSDLIARGRAEIHHGSVSRLPFPNDTFDLVTAVETHFWWPDPPNDMREVFRVTKPGGTLVLIAEVYKGASHPVSQLLEKHADRTGLLMLSPDEHRDLLAQVGYSAVQVHTDPNKGWICAIGEKPSAGS